MKKGRFCRSWIFSPKCRIKVGGSHRCSGDNVPDRHAYLCYLVLHSKNQKLKSHCAFYISF